MDMTPDQPLASREPSENGSAGPRRSPKPSTNRDAPFLGHSCRYGIRFVVESLIETDRSIVIAEQRVRLFGEDPPLVR